MINYSIILQLGNSQTEKIVIIGHSLKLMACIKKYTLCSVDRGCILADRFIRFLYKERRQHSAFS